jgi:hypothetical protein
MKFSIFCLVFFLIQKSWGSCNQELVYGNDTYCVTINWLSTQQKMNGVLQPTQEMSPYLNKQGTRPSQWHLSNVSLQIWKKGDSQQQPVQIQGLRIFPYMHMLGGMHHGASYQFSWNETLKSYRVFGFSMTQMKGCWSLRWTVEASDDFATSQKLIDITNYSNNNDVENFDAETLCSLCAQDSQSTSEGHLSHH